MSASSTFPLRYVLPTTALTLRAALRLVVVVDDLGGHLEPEVSASLTASWRRDALTSARGVLGDGGDPLGGSVPASAVPGSLRRAFDRAHPRTAALISDLSARSEQYLAGLRMGEEPAQVVTFGQALEIVHRELAAADRARREWISRQGRDVRSAELALSAADMITLAGPAAMLPGDTEIPAGRAQDLAARFGLLLALVSEDGSASAGKGSRSGGGSAGVAVYRRRPDSWPGQEVPADPRPEWVRDDVLSQLRLGDAGDPAAELPQPRHSPETERLVGPLGLSTAADPDVEAAIRVARTQLDLLDASDEYSRIAATQYRAEEIASLRHMLKLAFMPRQRGTD